MRGRGIAPLYRYDLNDRCNPSDNAALAIHELATNAAKYGALAVSSGRVRVSWLVDREEGEIWLRLSWAERGVHVEPATRRGFGTELISGRVPYELQGRGAIRIASAGAEARIEFPLRAGESILQTDASKLLGNDAV